MDNNSLFLGAAALLTAVGALITAIKTNRKIKQTAADEQKKRAETAAIIEETAASQVLRVREEADRAALALAKKADEAGKFEAECSSMRVELSEMKCRLDTDMEACKQEIRDLRDQVQTLKTKNDRLVLAINKLLAQIRCIGHIPEIDQDELG